MCDLLEMKAWAYHPSTHNPLTASLCSSSPNSFSRTSKVPGYLSNYPSSRLSILIFLSIHWTFLISSTLLSPLDSLYLNAPLQLPSTHTPIWPTPIHPSVPCSSATSSPKPTSLAQISLGPLVSPSYLLSFYYHYAPWVPGSLLCSIPRTHVAPKRGCLV